MLLNNSRYMITNTTSKYGNNSAVRHILFQSNKKNSCSIIKPRQLATTTDTSNKAPESAKNQVPTTPKKSSSLKVVALALTGFTVGLGFAVLNPDSRKQIQDVVPQANLFFDMVDDFMGRKKVQTPSIKSIEPKKIQPLYPETSQVEKKQEQVVEAPVPLPAPVVEVAKPEPTPSPVVEVAKLEPTPVPVAAQPVSSSSTQTQTEQPAETAAVSEPPLDLDWKKTLKRHELQEEATIDAIETKLNNFNAALRLKVDEAIASTSSAIASLNNYSQALRNALDENRNEDSKDSQWKEVTELFNNQSDSVRDTKQKIQLANKAVEELENLLNEVKTSDLSVKNLRQTQIDLIEQCRRLQAEKTKLSEAIIHANVLRSYTNEQKMARSQFMKEMQALQPDGIQIVNRPEDQLTNEEINNLLIHAHKRVLQLQKQIDKIQTAQSQQIQDALEEQRKQNAQLQKENESNLYELAKKEFDLEKEEIIEKEKVKTAEEIKKELSRQSAAHNNHLAQMLKMQQDELRAFYDKKLIFENEKTRQEFYSKVADSLGRIKGIENAINARANLELQSNNAKQLWLAVQNLSELLSRPSAELTPQQELVSIKSNIDTIKQSAPDNEFIQRIVDSIPSNALQNGVWTEPDLKDRFYKLKTICSRVALIDERGGSLFKYFISYLQSFFIMHAKIDQSEPAKLDDINLNSTFNILDHAQFYLENGNIESAIRLMQQLKGEPYRLAKDWIKDAICLLEIKQACQLLTAYISGVYISSRYNK